MTHGVLDMVELGLGSTTERGDEDGIGVGLRGEGWGLG